MGDALANPKSGPVLREQLESQSGAADELSGILPDGVPMETLLNSLPLGQMSMTAGDAFTPGMLDDTIELANSDQE